MKHGMKFRKLSRTSSHRQALLRNLVSALLHHEQIQTTLPKAKEAARMAEKIISLGKKGTRPAFESAQAILYPAHHYANPTASSSSSPTDQPTPTAPATSLLPKLFTTLSERYSDRPGGYTRITKFGRRPGDNAPKAIVSLVAGPRDIREEMNARAVGRELGMSGDVGSVQGLLRGVVAGAGNVLDLALRPITRRAMEKSLRYGDGESKEAFVRRATEHAVRVVQPSKFH